MGTGRLHGEEKSTWQQGKNMETESMLPWLPDTGSVLTVADIKSVVEFLSSMLLITADVGMFYLHMIWKNNANLISKSKQK